MRLVVLALMVWPATAQLRKQEREGAPVRNMTAAERTQLGDPFFLLVLKPKPNETRLDEIEKLIVGRSGKRRLFVVSEEVMDAAAGTGHSRRTVTGYTGVNQGMQLDPNVSLSVFFTDQAFRLDDLEAMGWDDARNRYNYYKLDRQGGALTWKFRGSSVDADKLTPEQRAGTCLRCHITGGPVMKELPIPWNNWHSFRSLVGYLSPDSPNAWAIAKSPRFLDLAGAQDFETSFVLPSIKQFDGRRVDALTRAVPGGRREATDGRRLLRPLFETLEYNLTSADQPSGLHPFPTRGDGPVVDIQVPDTFFLNANLLAGGGFTRYQGLGIAEARQFADVLKLTPAEYRDTVKAFQTRIGGREFDANFAWLVPEASHADNQMADILVRRGIVTAEFAAAVLAVDLENPVFSQDRESLLQFVPARFRFKPRNAEDVPPAHPDELTTAVIQAVRASGVPAGSARETFVKLLEDPQPVQRVREAVAAYLARQTTSLEGVARAAEIRRLYRRMLERRIAAQKRIPDLVESNFLFPTGSAQ